MATKHSATCKRVFANYDLSCPRCIELSEGAKPRKGWQADYFAKKKLKEERFRKALREHDCEKSGCGPICTAFDW